MGNPILWVGGTELRIIAQVAHVPPEGIKSDVVSWGLEFPGENKGNRTIYFFWAKSGLVP